MNFDKEQKISTLIHNNYRLIPIISRFGINFGFGDKTIAQICDENNINPFFFLEIIKMFYKEHYMPNKSVMKTFIPETIDYLLKSHKYYNEIKIPLIEQLITSLFWIETKNNVNRNILKKFFNEYKKEVIEHTANEEENIYPYIIEIHAQYKSNNENLNLINKIKSQSITNYADKHESLNSALLDLKNIIIKYLPPAINNQTAEQIVEEIFKLEKDMDDHTKIEDTILVPIIKEMEQNILNQNNIN